MRSIRVVLVVAMLALTGCGGPRDPIEVAVKEFPGDVAIGKKTTVPPPAELTPTAVNPQPMGFPSFIQPPPPFRTVSDEVSPGPTTTKPKAVACAVADPLATPKREATRNVSLPPADQTLVFRNDGTYSATDRAGKVQQGTYPAETTRTIGSRKNPDGTFDYVVHEAYSGSQTTTLYRLDPTRGLYLWQIVSVTPTGNDTFTADRPDALLILPLPVTNEAAVGGFAVDVRTATAMTLNGKVIGKSRVDACGTPIDTWQVQITDGRITGPDKQVRFTATYDIGTQYGALSLREVVEHSCDEGVNTYCDNGRKVVTKNTATAAAEPKVRQA